MDSKQVFQSSDHSATLLDDECPLQQSGSQAYAASETTCDAPFHIGDVLLGVYRVESGPIHGGMGSVWRVHHTGWNVDLAMKRPQPRHFVSSANKTDFIHECQSWVGLDLHPNIVSCYYIREIDHMPTIFSEWMDGGSLKDAIRRGTLYQGSKIEQQSRLLDIAIQIARGLAYAHKRDLIHQDIKPDNLLLTSQWDAKVGDFGLSRAKNAFLFVEDALDEYGKAIGNASPRLPSGGCTLAYCSSEQLSGKSLTRQTDIYSWAVTMLEMYLGTRPWPSGVVAGIGCWDYFDHTRVPLSKRMRQLLAYCLMAEPLQRPYDFIEIETELLSIYQEETGVPYARPAYKPVSDTADSFNNKALSYLDLGMTEQAKHCWEFALNLNPNHLLTIYNSALYLWRAAVMDDTTAIQRVKLIGINSASADTARLIDMLNVERGMPETQMREQPILCPRVSDPELKKVSISEDGSFAVLAFCDGIRRVDLQSGTVTLFSDEHLLDQMHPTLSWDGAFGLSSYRHHYVALWNAASGAFIRTLDAGYDFYIDHLAFSPSGVLAAAVMTNKETSIHSIALWNVETGELLRIFDVYGMASFLCFTPDSDYIVCDSTSSGFSSEMKTEIHLWRVRTGKYVRNSSMLAIGESVISISGDGAILAAGGGLSDDILESRIIVWSLTTKRVVCFMRGSNSKITTLKLNHDGSLAVSGSADGSVKLWEIPSGRCLCTFGGTYQSVNAVSFTPDEQSVIAVVTCKEKSPNQFCSVCWRVPSFTSQANMELAKIVSLSDFLEREQHFQALLRLAKHALNRNEPGNALDCLMVARRIPGFENDADWQAAYASVAYHCRIDGLHSTAKDSPLEFHIPITSFTVCSKDIIYITSKSGDVFRRDSVYSTNFLVHVEPHTQQFFIAQSGVRYCITDKDETITCYSTETQKSIASVQASLKAEFPPEHSFTGGTVIGEIGLYCAEMSGDGRFVALGDYNGMIQLWQIDSGVVTLCCGRHAGRIEHLEFSPGGTRLLSCGFDRQYRVWDVASGKCLLETQDIHCWTQAGCFYPDGKQIVIAGESNDIICVDIDTGEQVARFPGRNETILRLCISPDGSTIFVLTSDYLDIFDRKGAREQRAIPLRKQADDCQISLSGMVLYLHPIDSDEISRLRLEWDYVYDGTDSPRKKDQRVFRE